MLHSADALQDARRLAISDHRAAIDLLNKRLAAAPDDVDARVFRGIVLSWERRFDESRADLERSLAEHPAYTDASVALTSVGIWSGHPDQALAAATEAVLRAPGNVNAMLARARAFSALRRNAEAQADLREVLRLEPANTDAHNLERALETSEFPWEVLFQHGYETFGKALGPFHEYRVEMKRTAARGDVIGRYSHGQRFGFDSNQAELDYYPKLAARTSAYLNAGVAGARGLYPRYRVGADLIQSFGRGIEVSGGMRRLGFSQQVNVYTGSLGKYAGKWLLAGRFFIAPAFVGASGTVQLTARRYLTTRGDFASLTWIRGNSALEIRNIGDTGVLTSSSVQAELRKSAGRRWILGLRTGYGRDDRRGVGRVDRFLLDTSIGVRF